jgi:hypothetical protein
MSGPRGKELASPRISETSGMNLSEAGGFSSKSSMPSLPGLEGNRGESLEATFGLGHNLGAGLDLSEHLAQAASIDPVLRDQREPVPAEAGALELSTSLPSLPTGERSAVQLTPKSQLCANDVLWMTELMGTLAASIQGVDTLRGEWQQPEGER